MFQIKRNSFLFLFTERTFFLTFLAGFCRWIREFEALDSPVVQKRSDTRHPTIFIRLRRAEE